MAVVRRVWVSSVVASPVWSGRARSVLLRLAGVRCREVEVRHGLVVNGDAPIVIGRLSFLNVGVLLDAEAPITLGSGVALGPRTNLVTSSHRIGPAARRSGALDPRPITIHDGVWVGAGVTVLAGVTIGAGCVIAAGAVVTGDCAPHGLYAGVPAQRRRDVRHPDDTRPDPTTQLEAARS